LIRYQRMFELIHLVLDAELALLEAPELQVVHVAGRVEARDHLVEIAMFDAKLEQTAGNGGAVVDGEARFFAAAAQV